MPELTHEYSPRCRPLDAPSRNGIGTLVHVDPHSIACQQSKQIPEKMQRRGKRRRACAAYQRCELAGCRDATQVVAPMPRACPVVSSAQGDNDGLEWRSPR